MLSRLHKIYKEIDEAKERADKQEKPVTLIAVSKNFPQSAVLPLLKEGHRNFGENRVQEARQKYETLKTEYEDLVLHLIGPLQANKVKEAVEIFDVIHSIDREKTAALVNAEMHKQNKKLSCFLQVNIGLEPQKSGLHPKEVLAFLQHCRQHYQFNILGLMAIPPLEENPGPYFSYMQNLRQACALPFLSMGMSEDFGTAIAFGADYVRVGTKLFGQRA